MAPSIITQTETEAAPSVFKHKEPLRYSGSLDKFEQVEVTPTIGLEFPKANVVDWLHAENSDALIRDLAIKISEHGVVFFRAQNSLTNELQKTLITKLGKLSGRPSTSGLHIHPILNPSRGDSLAGSDLEISTISSEQDKKFYGKVSTLPLPEDSRLDDRVYTAQWHSDISFESVPADYSSLRLTQLPKTGGDTLWGSGCGVYDRISPPYRQFLETLTVTFAQPGFNRVAERQGFLVHEGPRGAPENVGAELKAVHPLVRTNPVTGWKSVFPIGGHISHVNGLAAEESRHLLQWFQDLLQRNHDLQVRFKWLNKNDLAIWDNRSVFHTATFDYEGYGERFGNRAVGLGERPYFDPLSRSRKEDLEERAKSAAVRLNTQ